MCSRNHRFSTLVLHPDNTSLHNGRLISEHAPALLAPEKLSLSAPDVHHYDEVMGLRAHDDPKVMYGAIRDCVY